MKPKIQLSSTLLLLKWQPCHATPSTLEPISLCATPLPPTPHLPQKNTLKTSHVLTCSGGQVEDKYSQHAGEDAGQDDVDDVKKRLPFYDEIESDVFIQILLNVLSRGFMTDGPFSILCGERTEESDVDKKNKVCL